MQSAIKQDAFAEDVRRGLSAASKFLSSKYFYDEEGSKLFQRIMGLPEYYLTGAEFEIFSAQMPTIFEAFAEEGISFDLVELGAGDGTKTAVLIDYLLRREADFTYSPIDISQEAIDGLTEEFRHKFPALRLAAKCDDYLRGLEHLRTSSGQRRKIILFLGSNIGNFSTAEAAEFLRKIRARMSVADLLFTGFDLHKDPRVILHAYDDAAGITAEFNLNLLRRINRELGANFQVEMFSHYAAYHPIECAARSFLISRERQTVEIAALGQNFEFAQWEPVFTEISQKYDFAAIENLARSSGFQVIRNFLDHRAYFADSLWKIR